MMEDREKKAVRRAMDAIEPDGEQRARMLRRIQAQDTHRPQPGRTRRFAVPAVAAAVLMLTAAVLTLWPGPAPLPVETPAASGTTAAQPGGTTAPGGTATVPAAPSEPAAPPAAPTTGAEDEPEMETNELGTVIEKAENEFMFDGRLYARITAWQAEQYGLPAEVPADKAGERLGTIEQSVDKTLIGCTVYRYDGPLYGEWVYAAERDGKTELYLFAGFHSPFDPTPYEEPDRAAAELLHIYGVDSAADIDRIELWDSPDGVYEHRGTVRQTEKMAAFYEVLRVLVSDRRGEEETLASVGRAFAARETTAAASVPDNVQPGFVGYAHYACLDSVQLRLCLKNGYTMELDYRPRMQYLSQYPLNAEQDTFLRDFCASV